MAAKIMDGKKLSEKLVDTLKLRMEKLQRSGVFPKLDIILAGDYEPSRIYVKRKIHLSRTIGISTEVHEFPYDVKENKIVKVIKTLNSDKNVHGILLQLPLPRHIEERKIIDNICPSKDVDGLTTYNLGKLFVGEANFEPCTPKGIIKLIEHEKIALEGMHVVIVGRSKIVGRPLAAMLLNRNATVTICHSKTKDLKAHTKSADILVVAVGKPKFINDEFVKEGSAIIDVGINRIGGRIVGDVDFEQVKQKVSYITPVPGGVGPMTVAMLMENTILAAESLGADSKM